MQDAGGGQRSQRTGTQPSQEAAAKRLQVSMERQARAGRWENRPGGQGSRPGPSPKGKKPDWETKL